MPDNSTVNSERATQNRVIKLLRDFCDYKYLGNLKDQDNMPYREEILKEFLTKKQGCTEKQAEEATKKLRDLVAQCHDRNTLYNVNKEIYHLLRYPTSVSRGFGLTNTTVSLIDWENPGNNLYHIAEEVTVARTTSTDEHRRPDVVIYINGIAVCVIELKKASVSVHEGIRQNIRNQEDGQIAPFFSTAQLLLAGNESEGVHYGTILTAEKFYLKWKEPTGAHYSKPTKEPDPYTTPFPVETFKNLLDRTLLQMLNPKRLIEFLHDCVVFDGGKKKVARPNQYFALHACKQRCIDKENGIIWHSQGAGKSLTMVWLAQWILENISGSRVVVITDRDELDEQITDGFADADIHPTRAVSGEHLIKMLNGTNTRRGEQPEPNLITTLVHKFGVGGGPRGAIDDGETLRGKPSADMYLKQVAEHLPAGFKAKGNLYVFVDECHRTQGGVLNQAMRKIMGEGVMLIGFTGTPLLKTQKDKLTSREAFGTWISTYKFDEAVRDKVVRDLRYEARSVPQILSNKEDFDELFEAKTATLTRAAKERLQRRWATMQELFSSRERIDRITAQIYKDFQLIPCLREGWGNAMLVADSIYQAFRYWDAFERSGYFRGHTAVVTSYIGEEPGLQEGHSSDEITEAEFKHAKYIQMIGERTPEQFEAYAKEEFVKHPATMKILIVVDKLLTGFDAPAATYMYIDSVLHNHTLFQAICRVNRNNGEQKQFGYIIDYKDLFNEISQAVEDYTNGEFGDFAKEDVQDLLKGRLKQAKKDLDAALTLVKRLSEPVEQPKSIEEYFDYFCYNQVRCIHTEEQQAETERNAHKREDFYDACATLVRCYVAISLEMENAGYTAEEAAEIYKTVKNFDELRNAIMHRSGDYFDMRMYDAEMRALLDDYVTAPRAEVLEKLDDFSFLDIIEIKSDDGGDDVQILVDPAAEEELGGHKGVAETLVQNVRHVINRKRDTNPEEYKYFSEKINRLLEEFQQNTIEYKELLKRIVELSIALKNRNRPDPRLATPLHVALYDNLGHNIDLALHVYSVIEQQIKPNFRNDRMRMRKAQKAVQDSLLGTDYDWQVIYGIIDAHTEFQP